jgi:fibronectin-binding autotransporter adhesin
MKPQSALRSFLLLAGGTLLAISYSHAATLTWDANAALAGQTDGLGAWLGTDQWWNPLTNSNTTWTSNDSGIFGNGGTGGAVSLASATTVSALSFNYFTGTYSLGTLGSEITLGNGGITKTAGAGVVTLSNLSPIKSSAAQTFTNNSATNLVLGAVNLNGNALTFSGTGVTTFEGNTANVLSGAGGIIKNGTGGLILDAGAPNPLHTFSGGIVVNGGAVRFQTAANVSGRGNVTLNGGYLGGRFGSSPTFTGGLGTGATQIQILGGVSGFSGEGATSSNFSIVNSSTTLKWGATGENGATGYFNPTVLLLGGDQGMNTNAKGSLNNPIDLNGTTRTITSLHTNGDGAATTGFSLTGAITTSTGTAGLIKTGPGAIILQGANTYNGATSIQGGSLILSGTVGAINSTTSLGLSGGGTLRMVNTAQVNRFADGAAITSAGGGISYENTSGATVYTETLGAVALNGGLLNLVQNTNQAGAGSQTLTLGTSGSSNLTQSGTGSVAFSALTTGPQASGNKNMIVVTGSGTTSGWTSGAASNPIIGPWATTGTAAAAQTDYAVYDSNHVVPAATAASDQSTWVTSTDQYTAGLVGTAGTTLGATRNISALKATTSATALTSVTFAGAAATDFITVTGNTFANGDVVNFGGTAPGGLSTGIPYYVINVGTNGPDTFTVSATSGGAPIELTSAGTSPNVLAGITLGSGMDLGTTGILNSGAGGVVIGKGTGGVLTLPSTTSANLYVNTGNGAAIIVGAPIADNGAGVLTLVKTGASTLRLVDVNTYTGNTAINSGTLQIGVNGQTTGAKLGGAGGNYAGNIFIQAGANLDFQTNSNQTLSGVISGDGNLLKRYIGTLTLGDDNTYTGKTTIGAITNAGDPTLVVSSFNSVNGGTPLLANSSLGAPTTIANGTIEIGSNNSTPNPTLRYGGVAATGETTDRIIHFIFNSTATRTLDASNPSGLLKFTSAFTSNGTSTGHMVLRGTGNAEIVQGLPFAFTNLTKSDAGTWTLGGNVGNTGTTTISAGKLVINGTQANSGAISVNGTSTLGGSGSLGGAVTVAAGANLEPGASAGTLTIRSSLNISAMTGSTGVMNFELGPIAASDKIVAGTVNIGTLAFDDFNFSALTGLANGTYTLIQSGGITGSLDPDSGDITGTIGAGPATGTLQITGNNIELVVTGVPGGSGYATWATANGIGGQPFGDDFDKDGISNGVEYALGLNPIVSSQPPGAFSGNTITFTKGADAIANDDVSWIIETSETLATGSWTAEVTQANTNNDPTISYSFTLGTPAKKFARLKVVQVP